MIDQKENHFHSIHFLSAALLTLVASACDQTAIPPNANVTGASKLAFRCIDLSTDEARVAPLESCGCLESELNTNGGRELNTLNRDDCQKNTLFEIVGYLGSPAQQKIAVMRLDHGPRAILDQSESIPGITHFNAGDLISELFVHPYGDFMFTLNYTTGVISLSFDHRYLRPDMSFELGIGQISDAVVWPSAHQALPEQGSPSLLYVSSIDDGKIYEIDLDLLSLSLMQSLNGESSDATDFTRRSWPIQNAEGENRAPDKISVNERRDLLAITHLGHNEIQLIKLEQNQVDEEEEDQSTSWLHLKKNLYCRDAYLTQVLAPARANETCHDGVDNNRDGLIDSEDRDCVIYGVEAENLACPQLSECADLLDNDGDGLIDAADPECALEQQGEMPKREDLAPACDDGLDNDDDGLIDRADPGCEDQDDRDEASTPERSSCFDGIDNDGDGAFDTADEDCQLSEQASGRGDFIGEGDDLCSDGFDNDSDGLVDAEDPGCTLEGSEERFYFERTPECTDGIDNDRDGLVDFGEDPDCLFAADRREGSDRLSDSRLVLEIISLPDSSLEGAKRDLLVTHDEDGALVKLSLNGTILTKFETRSEIVFPHSIERRVTGSLITLWVLDQSNKLSALHLTSPKPILYHGKHVYVRGEVTSKAQATLEENQERQSDQSIQAEALYIVEEGTAYRLSALDTLLPSIAFDSYTRVPMIDPSAQEILDSLDSESLDILTPLQLPPGAGGIGDPQLFISGVYEITQGRWNRNRTALGQMNRVSDLPNFTIDGVQVSQNRSRHVGFCTSDTLANPNDEGTDEETQVTPISGACTLVGVSPTGSLERDSESKARRVHELESYEGIKVTTSNYDEMISGEVSVSYEGKIPNSTSRTGSLINSTEDQWKFVDYLADFCALGVEEGDLFIADRFYPLDEASAADASCAPYLNRSPTEGEDPLRYRIAKVSQHSLSLVQDDRESYAPQLDLLGSSRLPKLASSLPPPPFHCAAQAISYSLRVGKDQWVVDSQASGFNHSWKSKAGECVRDPHRVEQKWNGRARLGKRFENRWFSFTLGYQAAQLGVSGIPSDQLPIMVGSVFKFNLVRGVLNELILGAGVSPSTLKWLPEKDRLYLVDSSLKSVTEYDGADPYLGSLRVVQTFQ